MPSTYTNSPMLEVSSLKTNSVMERMLSIIHKAFYMQTYIIHTSTI